VWIKKDGRWVITFEQGTPIAEATLDNAKTVKELNDALARWLAAFNDHAPKRLAAEYADDADVQSPTGERMVGRDAVEKSFAEFFAKHPNVKQRLADVSRKAIGPNLVVEEGAWEESDRSDGSAAKGRYSSVLTRSDGKWLVLYERAYETK
jgi:uncharacterized protein (TIGR02246 family)